MPAFVFRGKHFDNPVQLSLDLIGGKWKMPILWRLQEGPLRYSELMRSLNAHLVATCVTDKMLAAHLRQLESDGLIERRVFSSVPPKVEYSITEHGLRVIPAIRVLQEFGRWYQANPPHSRHEDGPLASDPGPRPGSTTDTSTGH